MECNFNVSNYYLINVQLYIYETIYTVTIRNVNLWTWKIYCIRTAPTAKVTWQSRSQYRHKCQFAGSAYVKNLKMNLKWIWGMCVYDNFRHITSNAYQHTNELTLICDQCWLRIGSDVSKIVVHTHTSDSFQIHFQIFVLKREIQGRITGPKTTNIVSQHWYYFPIFIYLFQDKNT